MRKIGLSLSFVTIVAVNSAWAADYPKAYEATYRTTVVGDGNMQHHCMSDGKGHVRCESSDQNGIEQICLMDYPQHTITTTIDINGQKRFMKTSLPDYEGEDAFKKDAKDLGTKVIDNNACHGYEKTFKDGRGSVNWYANDTNRVILQKSVGFEPNRIIKLKSWVNKAPSFSMSLPRDYKLCLDGRHTLKCAPVRNCQRSGTNLSPSESAKYPN